VNTVQIEYRNIFIFGGIAIMYRLKTHMCKHYRRGVAICLSLLASNFIGHEHALAQSLAESSAREYLLPKGAIGVGTAIVNFDTKIKLTDKSSDLSLFLDPEGNLDLPEIARVNTFYAAYRIGRKHQLGFAYFAVKRESTFFSEDVNLEDIIIADGRATLSDNTKFYFFNYSYALFQDNRSGVNGLFGISGLDLKYTIEASGELIIDGKRQFDTYHDEASVFAPLPLFGLDFYYAFTPKWSIRSKVALVGGKYQDIRAGVFQTGMNANYWFTKHVGGVVGISYFTARVVIENDAEKQEIDYGYSGFYAGLHFAY
jgi:hypothetical protein